ncbi:hypothetical protein M899_3485 [Bacteriovorax sp. BSW11_IV]|uniref:hypothetical protein n=1 Tax=Bacteriovorax sp. BSW11_IV TaxID=1353529 RepID=UPI00038A230B|nr:hypothetical protein [Bacteriovorax sp. BSW11_IV]EQC50054.1 hypothetical protein M899_3485 [Bacteriovorax sp. BSW11_IV]
MKKWIFSLALILSFKITAAVPTAEGLLRNPNNNDITGNLILLNVSVLHTMTGELSDEAAETTKKSSLGYYKFLLNNEERRSGEIIQGQYFNSSFSDREIARLDSYRNLGATLQSDQIIERELFYSLMMMFAMNESKYMGNFIKKYSSDFKLNNEMLNREKVKLLDEYKKYLTMIKADPSLKDHVKSPLAKEGEEEAKKIKEIMDSPTYDDNKNVELVKIGENFFWKVKFDNGEMMFSNEEHQLQQMTLNFGGKKINVYALEYLLFDGQHEMPKKIKIEMGDGNTYDVSILVYKDILSKNKTFSERLKDLKTVQSNVDVKTREPVFPMGITY